MPHSYTCSYRFGVIVTNKSTFVDVVIIRPTMGDLIHVGLFCCLLFVKVCVCLSLGDEEVSDSFIQVLMRKMHKQDEKISAIEANTKLDLVSKILRLEEKLKDSDYKQKKSEKTIENMDKIIKELETKTRTKNEENLKDGHFSEKKEQENSNSEPAAVNVFQKTTNVSQDRSAAVGSKQKRILNGGVYRSKLSSSFTRC